MQTITATEFQSRCLELLDGKDPEGVVITRDGKPVARLTPYRRSADLIGSLKGRLKIKGDIMSTGLKWDAES